MGHHARLFAKRSLGQHFLIDHNICYKIIESAHLSRRGIVLEIGPGQGILTQALLKHARRVFAIEVDKRLVAQLKGQFDNDERLELIQGNFLKMSLSNFCSQYKIAQKLKVVSNIPYNITSPILNHLFEDITLWHNIIIMVQREFAERLIARVGTKNYASISCFAQYFTEPKILFPVSRRCFRPRPHVDSCVVELRPRVLKVGDRKRQALFRIIRTAFQQRRKNLSNALSPLIAKEKISLLLDKIHIRADRRPDQVSLSEYELLATAWIEDGGSTAEIA